MMMAIMMTMMTTMLGWNGCVFFDQRRNHLMEWCNLRSGDSVGGGAAAVVGRPPARQQLSSTRICSFGVFCVFCLSRGFLYFVFAAAAQQSGFCLEAFGAFCVFLWVSGLSGFVFGFFVFLFECFWLAILFKYFCILCFWTHLPICTCSGQWS